jgi:hypothetical protein
MERACGNVVALALVASRGPVGKLRSLPASEVQGEVLGLEQESISLEDT